MDQIDAAKGDDLMACLGEERVGGDCRATVVPRRRGPQLDDLRSGEDAVPGPQRTFEPKFVEAHSADEIDVSVHLVIQLSPDGQNMHAARHQLPEHRVTGRVGIGVKPLRIPAAGKLQNFVGSNVAQSRLATLSNHQIFELAGRAHALCHEPGPRQRQGDV